MAKNKRSQDVDTKIVKMEFDGNVFLSKEELFHIKKEYKG